MSTLLHRLVLSIELGTVHTGTAKVDPAGKLKYTTAAHECNKKGLLCLTPKCEHTTEMHNNFVFTPCLVLTCSVRNVLYYIS